MNSSARSWAEKTRPFGPLSGYVAGDLWSNFLLSLYIEPSLDKSNENMNLSHSSCFWVNSMDLIKAILLFNRRFLAGSLYLYHSHLTGFNVYFIEDFGWEVVVIKRFPVNFIFADV